MNKKTRNILAYVFLLGMVGCNIDIPDRTSSVQVSETIEESKARGVFLAEYRPNRDLVKKAWAETPWVYDTLVNIRKSKGFRLYILSKDSISLSDSWLECEQGDTSNGTISMGIKRQYKS